MKYWFGFETQESFGFHEGLEVVAYLMKVDDRPHAKRCRDCKNAEENCEKCHLTFLRPADPDHLVDILGIGVPAGWVVLVSLWKLTVLDIVLALSWRVCFLVAPQ